MSNDSPIFLTVRGKANAETLEAARALHNQTAGNPQGVAAAQSLGDFSHNVYVPVVGAQSSAQAGELMFHDVWENPKGLMDFFSNPDVQKGGAALFKARDATVWMPAVGAFGFNLPSPALRTDRLIGMIRGQIGSAERAIETFKKVMGKSARDARRHGQLSHQLYIKMNPPGDSSPLELLGVDVWYDAAGMAEHYKTMNMADLGPVFSAPPDASIWKSAPGQWVEW